MRKIVTAAALLALAAPTVSQAADPSGQSAEDLCRAQRTAIGADAFKALYGTNKNKSNAFGKCVSKAAKSKDASKTNASKDCKTERAADPAAFKEKYGTNKSKSNAFGKCVSSKASAADAAKQKATINAAKACKTERKADPAAFKEKYGTNKSKSNAFGKCVSAKVKPAS
jgi:hypothetical protein